MGVRTLFFSPLHYLQSSVALLILYYYAKTLTRPDRFMSFFFLKFLLRLFFLPTTRNWDTGGRLSPPNTGRGRGSLRSPASCESMNFAFSIFFYFVRTGPRCRERAAPSWPNGPVGLTPAPGQAGVRNHGLHPPALLPLSGSLVTGADSVRPRKSCK